MTADAGGLAWRHEKQRPALKNVKILTAAITPDPEFSLEEGLMSSQQVR